MTQSSDSSRRRAPMTTETIVLLVAGLCAILMFATCLPLLGDWIAALLVGGADFVLIAALLAPAHRGVER